MNNGSIMRILENIPCELNSLNKGKVVSSKKGNWKRRVAGNLSVSKKLDLIGGKRKLGLDMVVDPQSVTVHDNKKS